MKTDYKLNTDTQKIIIRKCHPDDRDDLRRLCCNTAYFGNPPDTLIVVGISAVEVGKWYHVLGCKNDIYSARLFINGVSETLESVGVPPSNSFNKKFSTTLHEFPWLFIDWDLIHTFHLFS